MSLMKFTPEAEHLRRAAKAYAAGEFTQAEYRAIRQSLIDNYQPMAADDDTQRRPVPLAVTEPEIAAAPIQPRRRRRWLWLAFVVVVGVTAAGLSYAATIAPLRDRDPNPATSPRLTVAEVRLDTAELPPELDQLAVTDALAAALAQARERQTPDRHGFTTEELAQVAALLQAFGVHAPDDRLDAREAGELSALIREQKARRGLSVLDLEEVAQAVQAAYRAQGYFLAVAYLPAQEVREGIVRIEVLPGRLGAVAVAGGDSDLVRSQFGDLLGQVVRRRDIEQRMYALNQLPGVQAQATFQPGDDVGSARLNVDILQRRPWSTSVRLDNHGDETTGEERLAVRAAWLDPRGVGDLIEGGLLTTLSPADQQYGFLRYQTPVVSGRYRLSAQLANNQFDYDGPVQIEGDSRLLDLSLTRTLRQDRTRSLGATLSGAWHRLGFDAFDDQSVFMLGGQLRAHRVWDAPRVYTEAVLGVEAGTFAEGATAGQDDGFWRLHGRGFLWLPLTLPLLPGEQKLSADLAWQYAGSELPATRRLNLAGAQINRGFERGRYRGDRGVWTQFALRQPLALGELFAFVDLGYASSASDSDKTWGRLSSIGIGWDADITPRLSTRLSLGAPLASEGTGGLDDDGFEFYWSLEYAH